MKYVKLFEEFHEDQIIPYPDLLKKWSNMVWTSLDGETLSRMSNTFPTSLDEIVVIKTDEDGMDYIGMVTTDEYSKDRDQIYATIMEQKGAADSVVVAKLKVDTFLMGVSQLVAWTDMPGNEITHVKVEDYKKLNISKSVAADSTDAATKTNVAADLKMRKFSPVKNKSISDLPINQN